MNLYKLRDLRRELFPKKHVTFIVRIILQNNFKIFYDIGSCALHWHDYIKENIPGCDIYCFEGSDCEETKSFYQDVCTSPYYLGAIGRDNKKIIGQTTLDGTNLINIYPENQKIFNRENDVYLVDKEINIRNFYEVVKENNFPIPDLIKMDIQGAELDVILGGVDIIKNCKALVVELPHEIVNLGAPRKEEVIKELDKLGFDCWGEFCTNGPKIDGDFLFINRSSNIRV